MTRASGSMIRQIESLFGSGSVAGLSDRQLIDRFNARRDATGEAAFAALVHRHGPMVLDVCRQLLGDRHHAEDAFQATFLVLARKAGTIRDPDLLGTWLYGVAIRTARKSRARLARLRKHEGSEPMGPADRGSGDPVETASGSAEESAIGREEAEAIHDEIDRLPKSFRLPVVLCYFEGLTLDEAARRLQWPAGTVRSRLARARDKLHHGLTRRGVALPAAAVAAALSPRPAAASVPTVLRDATTRTAIRFLAGEAVSASISAPAREVIRSMLMAKLGSAALTVLALSAAGAGVLVPSLLGKGELPGGQPGPGVAVTSPIRPLDAGKPPTPSPAPKPPAPAAESRRPIEAPRRPLSPWGERVERAIREGVGFLKRQQRPDGSWPDLDGAAKSGSSSLAALALLAAGEEPDSWAIRRALEFLRGFRPDDIHNTYSISLQTMVYAAAGLEDDRGRIAVNARWLEAAQIRPESGLPGPGGWGYDQPKPGGRGDNSNTQYALLGLDAAREVGVPVDARVWVLARDYWMRGQRPDGGWSYTPDSPVTTASMTCAGIASLSVTGLRRLQGRETLQGETIRDCGRVVVNRNVESGLDWLAGHFRVDENPRAGQSWRYYYLCGLERAGRLAGVRYLGPHDWYRQGADALMEDQDRDSGAWQGGLVERDRVLATSFALLFLTNGRAPVLINKLRHHPVDDWDRDPEDVAHLVEVVGRGWKKRLTWQVVDSGTAALSDLQRAPILFFNGHRAPEFSPQEKENLRAYIEQGGFLFAEACCGERDFDDGFRRLMKELFPEDDSALRPLPEDHPIWRARNAIEPARHPLWGIRRGDRTAVVYSPKDLSCYWNQFDQDARSPAVIRAIRVGQNVIDYATNRELPPDKLSVP